jgi:hypothetical protein
MRVLLVGLLGAALLGDLTLAQDNSGWRRDDRENRANQRANEAMRRENARTEAILGRMGPNSNVPSPSGSTGSGTDSGCDIELVCPRGQYFAVYPRCRCVTPGIGSSPMCPAGTFWSLRKRCEPIGVCIDDKNFHRIQNGDCIPRDPAFRCKPGRMIDYSGGGCNNSPWRYAAPEYLPKPIREDFLAEARARKIKSGGYDALRGYRGSDSLMPPYAAPAQARVSAPGVAPPR